MKTIWIILFFFVQTQSMDLGTFFDQQTSEQALEAVKVRIEQGPECRWHLVNSFIQAIINPSQVNFLPNQINFTHYEYSHIGYFATYEETNTWLPLISESTCDLEKMAAGIITSVNMNQQLAEIDKFRIARAWLHRFLTDDSDSPSVVVRHAYVRALKAGDYEQLSQVAKSIAKYNNTTLLDEINQRRDRFLQIRN